MDKNTPLFDTKLTEKERARWIVNQLTLGEKCKMFAGHKPVDRLGLKGYYFGGEAAHGLQARGGQGERFKPVATTSFTQPIGMSASFDKKLIKEAGNVVGTEVRAFYNSNDKAIGSTRWAPTVDLCRDPRWGRNEEGYGEDPFLTGKMAGAYVEGIQDEHNYDESVSENGQRENRIRVGCNLKHFYANNVEWRRCYDSFEVSDKVKYDYELEPYRYCISESHAEGVMACYNGINGVTGMINPEIKNILKDEYGMKHAVCDGGAFQQVVNFHHDFETHAETFAASVKAGVDNMLDNPDVVYESAKEALERGLITEEELDESLVCMFESRIRLGAFDDEDPYDYLTLNDIGNKHAIETSKNMAIKTNVLLKNEDNFLPFDKSDNVVLIGPYADVWYMDWYGGKPLYKTTVKDGINEILNTNIKVEKGINEIILKCNGKYVAAYDEENPRLYLSDKKEDALVLEHTNWGFSSNYLYSKKHGKYVSFNTDGDLRLENSEAFSWYIFENLTMVNTDAKRLENPQNANMIEFDKYYADDESDINIYGFGSRTVIIENGFLKGIDISSILNVEGNKEGRNMESNYGNTTNTSAVFSVEIVKNGYEEAKKLAATLDENGNHCKVILALGCNPTINAKEEIDRKTINMIPSQERLFDEVYSVNENVAVVLLTNYPYGKCSINEKAKAILMNATGSQDMGYGIASALFGDSSPAGRCNMTWYLSDDDLVDIRDYDLINNKRTYRYFDKPVLYPFGYGLTYTDIKYNKISAVKCVDTNEIDIQVEITNIGDRTSDEVIQVYLKRVSESETVHPVRRLIGFERIYDILPLETKTISLKVKPSDIAIYIEDRKERVVEGGKYMIYAGANALDEARCVEFDI